MCSNESHNVVTLPRVLTQDKFSGTFLGKIDDLLLLLSSFEEEELGRWWECETKSKHDKINKIGSNQHKV